MTHEVTIDQMVSRWTSSVRPLFRGTLIDANGCKCAQGDVLSCAGYTDDELQKMAQNQNKADTETARILGISRAHSILLRQVNDTVGGSPQAVLSHPEEVIGSKAHILLAFWLHLDSIWAPAGARVAAVDAARAAAGTAAWVAAGDAAVAAAGDAARVAARVAAGDAAVAAAWVAAAAGAAAGTAAWVAAGDAAVAAAWVAAGASTEIQGMDILEKQGRQPYFLAVCGFDTWDKVCGLVGATA